MMTLFGGLFRRGHDDNRSSAPNPPDGTASLFLDAVQPSSAQLSTEEMKPFKEAQKNDEELQEVFSQGKE